MLNLAEISEPLRGNDKERYLLQNWNCSYDKSLNDIKELIAQITNTDVLLNVSLIPAGDSMTHLKIHQVVLFFSLLFI